MDQITIATLNISAASKERAPKLLDEWLIPTSYDIYVLTETSEGQGTSIILSKFRNAGWKIFQRPTEPKDRGVAIISRIAGYYSSSPFLNNEPMPGRTLIVQLNTNPQIEIIGMYVPNRGNDWSKTERKRAFLEYWLGYFNFHPSEFRQILLGDLNVVPTEQQPKFLPQQQFEYDWFSKLDFKAGLYDAAIRHGNKHESTWVAFSGEGYTYDHIMLQKELADNVVSFHYDHSTRMERMITDHSALVLTITLDYVKRISVGPIGEPLQTELF